MFPFFVIHETLSFFNRDGLERISICNRQFHQIVTKYFATQPYRYLRCLAIHCYTITSIAKVSERDLTESVISKIRSARRSEDSDGDIYYPGYNHYLIDLDELLPYLKHPAVYIAETRVYLSCETFQNVKQSLERAAQIWQRSSLLVSVYSCRNCNHESFYKDLLSSKVLLKTPNLTLDIDWKEVTFKLGLSKYSHLYDCNQFNMALTWMDVEEAADFVHSIPAHRQDSFSIQFEAQNVFEERKNKYNITAIMPHLRIPRGMTENTKRVISYFAVVNYALDYGHKFEALVDCCKRHFLDATTPLTYNISFVFCNANHESKIFKMENTNTLEQLELTSGEKHDRKYFCLRRMPL